MKNICLLLLVGLFQTATLHAQPQTAKNKITRDEAQHIALKQMPEGSVKSARLEQKDARSVWRVAIAKRGSDAATEILVDATSGRIVTAAEPASPAEGVERPKH
ncbi:MAG TPA: PepSY domain-containing protein [Chthoniobacterales bacterium]|nr:PepSY domain-containing protein [Chthoniobacterales bacterium]